MQREVTILTVSYKTPKLVKCLIESCIKFCPEDLKIYFIVVENSKETKYKKYIESLSDSVLFVNNEQADGIHGSVANSLGIEMGKQLIKTEYTIVMHSDFMVTSTEFFNQFAYVSVHHDVVAGTSDTRRIRAGHISCLSLKTELLKKVSSMPALPYLDVGDSYTWYCMDNNLPMFVFRNTLNQKELVSKCTGEFEKMHYTDRIFSLNSDEIIGIHLGRGTPKNSGDYYKEGRVGMKEWYELHRYLMRK